MRTKRKIRRERTWMGIRMTTMRRMRRAMRERRPHLPFSAGSNHGRRRDQLPRGWRCAAVRPGGKITLDSSRCVAFWALLWGLLEASWGLPGGLLGASWGPLGASSGPLRASWGRPGPSWGAFAPFRPFGDRLGGFPRPPWGSLGVLLGPS